MAKEDDIIINAGEETDKDDIIFEESFLQEDAASSPEVLQDSSPEDPENPAPEDGKKKGKKKNFWKKIKSNFSFDSLFPIIDRYILGKFLGTYFLATLLLLLVTNPVVIYL